ncbi:YfhO family protein [Zeaxanthinibacter enoshimensis]|uniref:YfhO family protein n=1 Tax=Zeaxanthinibacter enoshimensis TaxID=392009 RepID=UPI003568CE92
MKNRIHPLFNHFFALVLFVIAALAYFHPVLQGKVIQQSDIIQYTGMAKEQNDFRDKTDTEPYWTNSAFGGMPTYQLGAYYPHDYVKKLDRSLRFLPRPADYLFLYFLGFYILLCCLKVDYGAALLGAMAFGFSTYLIIILGVGHNAKAHAIAYLPMVLGGIILTFRKKYIWGFLLTAVAMALEIGANHYQMTYYFMLLVLILGLTYLVYAARNGQLKHFFMSVGLLLVAVVLGILANATSIMATKEYADWSTRGQSELTLDPEGNPLKNRDGLSREYITQYSYGITESLNLFIPRLFGGSNSENLGENSKTFEYLTEQGLPRTRALEFTTGLPLYWGMQPGVAAPAYIGAIVILLFLMGLFLVREKHKWWLLAGSLMALFLSWGKNFGLLTDFMIDFFPLYDKFRAVSSIQVILELCAPIMAVLALMKLFDKEVAVKEKLSALKISGAILIGLCAILLLLKGTFSFSGLNDAMYQQYFGDEILKMIERDREAVFVDDLLRSLVYVLLASLVLWLYIRDKIKKNILTLLLGILIIFDLVGVDLRYVNESDFVRKRLMDRPFQQTAVDRQIQQDSTIFRVYDPAEGLNGARTSYFHMSIGGYHAAKPGRLQDLFDYHVYRNNKEILDMLNVKYIVQQDQEGKQYAALNSEALGNAWFVDRLIPVNSADEEIRALDTLDVGISAVLNTREFPGITLEAGRDSLAEIRLTDYQPNRLVYVSRNNEDGLAVFSEMYYPEGWQATIDGKPVPHFRVNYTLRAMQVPAGEHKIEFEFSPKVVETGSTITLVSSLLLGILMLGGILYSIRQSRRES